jgi:hypothetical protein
MAALGLRLSRAKLCCRCFATVDCRGILNMIGRGTANAVPLPIFCTFLDLAHFFLALLF